jgi:hypothetical protein
LPQVGVGRRDADAEKAECRLDDDGDAEMRRRQDQIAGEVDEARLP